MRYLSADIIYPLHRAPIKEGVLVLDDGVVVDLLESREGLENLEIFEGFLCPGFVNTHCHLELSHMLGKLPEQIRACRILLLKYRNKERQVQKLFKKRFLQLTRKCKTMGLLQLVIFLIILTLFL